MSRESLASALFGASTSQMTAPGGGPWDNVPAPDAPWGGRPIAPFFAPQAPGTPSGPTFNERWEPANQYPMQQMPDFSHPDYRAPAWPQQFGSSGGMDEMSAQSRGGGRPYDQTPFNYNNIYQPNYGGASDSFDSRFGGGGNFDSAFTRSGADLPRDNFNDRFGFTNDHFEPFAPRDTFNDRFGGGGDSFNDRFGSWGGGFNQANHDAGGFGYNSPPTGNSVDMLGPTQILRQVVEQNSRAIDNTGNQIASMGAPGYNFTSTGNLVPQAQPSFMYQQPSYLSAPATTGGFVVW